MPKKLYTSPVGVAVYPHLNTPDTKFNPNGLFSVKLQVEGDKAVAFAARIDAAMDQAVKDAKDEAEEGKEIKRADRPYVLNDEGVYLFHFKVKHRNQTREGKEYFRRPVLFDSQGQRCDDAKIGGGSQLRVSYEPFLFNSQPLIGAGVSLRLFAVQVLSLIEWGERSAEGYGLENVEGGYMQPATEESGFEAASETDTPEATEGSAGPKFDF